MNAKAMVPLVLAVVLGLVAALLVRSAMSHKPIVPTGPSNLVTVVVAKQDADPGHALSIEDLGTAHVPADAAPGEVFSDPAQLVGRVTVSPLVKGETVLDNLLAPTGSGSGLQALIPPGMRAVTLEVSEFSGVGGMLEPGCRVDVVSVMQDSRQKQSVARTVLQNIKVSAVGRAVAPAHPAPGQPLPPPSNSVTLLCTPKQAQTLQLSTNTGRPWLVLRSTRDGAEVQLESTTLAELQGDATPDADPEATVDSAPPAAVPAPTPATPAGLTPADAPTPVAAAVPATVHRSVTVINGGVESQVTVTVPNPRAMFIDTNDGDTNYPQDAR
jgi:pilus assembly protein CpaB